ncbi:MAG: 2'-5' RNA ligase family protein [Actinomycetes bacterium]
MREHARPSFDGLRWVTAEQWHITLGFFGDLDAAASAAVSSVAADVAAAIARPTLTLGPRTQRLGRDGTLVIPAVGADPLVDVLDEALAGIVPPRRAPFSGHLTLARTRRRFELPHEVLDVSVEATFAPMAIYLFDSEPGPTGSVYEVRSRAPFAS